MPLGPKEPPRPLNLYPPIALQAFAKACR
jgi:hypothetical protein